MLEELLSIYFRVMFAQAIKPLTPAGVTRRFSVTTNLPEPIVNEIDYRQSEGGQIEARPLRGDRTVGLQNSIPPPDNRSGQISIISVQFTEYERTQQ